MFVKLFLADDGEDPPAEELHWPHLANRARRNRSRMAFGAAGFSPFAVKAASRFPPPVCQGWLTPFRVLRGCGLVPGCFHQVSCHVMELDMTALGHLDEQLEGLIS